MSTERFQRAILDAVHELSGQSGRDHFAITCAWRRAATTMPLDSFNPPLDIHVERRGEKALWATCEVSGAALKADLKAEFNAIYLTTRGATPLVGSVRRLAEAIDACIAEIETLEAKKKKEPPMDDITPVTVKQNTLDGKYFVWETEYPDEGAVAVFDRDPTSDELRALHPTYVRDAS